MWPVTCSFCSSGTVQEGIGPGIPSVFNGFWLADGYQRVVAGRVAGGAALVAGGLSPGWSS